MATKQSPPKATPTKAAPTKAAPTKAALTARSDERIAAPGRGTAFAGRTWFSITVAGILIAHLALLALFLWRDDDASTQLAKLDETPVEVVVVPPTAKTPETPEPPAPKPPDEKPATSAPRAANDTPVDAKAEDKDSHAPKADTPIAAAPPQPAPTPPSDVKETSDAAKSDAKDDPKAADADAPKTPDVLEKDAEALDKLVPEPPKRPAEFAKAKPPPHRAKTALQQLAGSSALPDYTFAKPMRKHAKVTGGTEDDRYLAVVYGMITQTHRPFAVPDGAWALAVAFQVDAGGNLVGIQIKQSSGYREVDAAAVQAVERAAPFPPPPGGTTTGLVARLHSLDAAEMAGDR